MRDCETKIVASIEFYMPGTDALGLFALRNSKMEKLIKFFHSRDIDKKVDNFLKRVLKNEKVELHSKWYVRYFSSLVPQSLKDKFHAQYSRFVPEFYSQTDVCIECMKCVKGCPRENIIFDESIKFGLECDMCLHCLHHCPTDSIQIGEYTKGTVRYNKVNID